MKNTDYINNTSFLISGNHFSSQAYNVTQYYTKTSTGRWFIIPRISYNSIIHGTQDSDLCGVVFIQDHVLRM
jgi:hypothetical protein